MWARVRSAAAAAGAAGARKAGASMHGTPWRQPLRSCPGPPACRPHPRSRQRRRPTLAFFALLRSRGAPSPRRDLSGGTMPSSSRRADPFSARDAVSSTPDTSVGVWPCWICSICAGENMSTRRGRPAGRRVARGGAGAADSRRRQRESRAMRAGAGASLAARRPAAGIRLPQRIPAGLRGRNSPWGSHTLS